MESCVYLVYLGLKSAGEILGSPSGLRRQSSQSGMQVSPPLCPMLQCTDYAAGPGLVTARGRVLCDHTPRPALTSSSWHDGGAAHKNAAAADAPEPCRLATGRTAPAELRRRALKSDA